MKTFKQINRIIDVRLSDYHGISIHARAVRNNRLTFVTALKHGFSLSTWRLMRDIRNAGGCWKYSIEHDAL